MEYKGIQKFMKIKILFAGLLTLALFTAAHAQTPDKAKLDQFFDRLAEKNKAMGSLTVARDGNVLYSRAIGYRQINGTEKKPLTAATRYRVGSITKMFTAALVFQLVEKGKLKLTDTLDKFFPQIPNAKKITIAHILAHRSGIHDLTDDRDYPTWKMNPKTQNEMLAIIAKGTPDFEPDAKYSYSNSGYVLLSYIVEKLTGKPYPLDGKTFYGHGGGIDGFGSWLAYLPEEKLAIAYTSNGKVYPVANIVGGVFDIYQNKPFQIPAFETIEVSPEVLDKYVGVYSSPGVPVKFTVTRDGATLYVQPTGQSAAPLEATAQDKFKIDPAGIVLEFDAAKNQMILKRRGREIVFTKEN